jgi:hypothetical protein
MTATIVISYPTTVVKWADARLHGSRHASWPGVNFKKTSGKEKQDEVVNRIYIMKGKYYTKCK